MAQHGKTRIRSRGPSFPYAISLGVIMLGSGWVGCTALADADFFEYHWITLLVTALALVHGYRWLSEPSVLIDRDAREIWFGRDCVPFSVFDGVYRTRSKRRAYKNGSDVWHSVLLTRNDGVQDKLVVHRCTDRGARKVQRIVAEALGVPIASEWGAAPAASLQTLADPEHRG